MSPPYLFRIDEIAETSTTVPRQRPDGHWEPSTNAGANVRRGGGVSGVWWYCNKQYFQAVELDDGPPIGSSLYKTYSVYYSDGCGIWVMDADATTLTNGDWHSWHTLTFDHYDDYSSYLTNAGEHHTLCIQRSGQRWPTLLLPDIYHTGRRITSASQYGGLIGELPILLGLIALSTPRAWLPNVLPTMFMGGKWQIHQYSQPREHQRGIVVYVYTAPSTWADGSNADDLRNYEEGRWGKYYH